MCILFLYVANKGHSRHVISPKEKSYKLILASNRDEKYSRPTAAAKFWEDADSHIIAGKDLEELGTWLGISKLGKLAVLLNIISQSSSQNQNLPKESRGKLVTGFLRSSPNLAGCTYLRNLCQEPDNLDISKRYNPFHLITVDILGQTNTNNSYRGETGAMSNTSESPTIDISSNAKSKSDDDTHTTTAEPSICVTYLSNNTDSSRPLPKSLTPPPNGAQFYAFGNNSMIDKPFRKLTCGLKDFEKIVDEHVKEAYEKETNDDLLVEKLLNFLKSTERYFPDEIMENEAKNTRIPPKLLPSFSSIFVQIPGADYGTRTHTIVLVDTQNNITFHEWTMEPPIDPSSPKWSHTHHKFKIDSVV